MGKRWISFLLCLCITVGLGVPAFAAEEEYAIVTVTLDGEEVTEFSAWLRNGTSYLPFEEGVKLFYPQAEVTFGSGFYTARAEGLYMTARAGEVYLAVNGRYLYYASGLPKRASDGMPLIPARLFCKAMGAEVTWAGKVELTSGEGPLSWEDRPYSDEDLDLISRVIMHESGYETLKGKMAVGNVILNRVANSQFPSSVSEVIYQKNQFPGATNATPNEESILAARLVLEGANVVPDAYFFNGVGLACWASRNKKLLYTIGGHAFYG